MSSKPVKMTDWILLGVCMASLGMSVIFEPAAVVGIPTLLALVWRHYL